MVPGGGTLPLRVYAPWMFDVMEFDRHAGEHILEIGGGMGTDHAQFAKAGGIMYDLDLSSGHLGSRERNFELRGLQSTFRHGDGETIPFPDDIVRSSLFQRRDPSHAEYRERGEGNLSRPEAGRTLHHYGLCGELAAVLAQFVFPHWTCSTGRWILARWARLCRATSRFLSMERSRW